MDINVDLQKFAREEQTGQAIRVSDKSPLLYSRYMAGNNQRMGLLYQTSIETENEDDNEDEDVDPEMEDVIMVYLYYNDERVHVKHFPIEDIDAAIELRQVWVDTDQPVKEL